MEPIDMKLDKITLFILIFSLGLITGPDLSLITSGILI